LGSALCKGPSDGLVCRVAAYVPHCLGRFNIPPWRVRVVAKQDKPRTVFCVAAERLDGDSTLDESCIDASTTPAIGYRHNTEGELSAGRSTGLLGIERSGKKGMQAQFAGSYRFFGAAVGIFITINRIMLQVNCSFATFYPD
jgi:hypothetical protein